MTTTFAAVTYDPATGQLQDVMLPRPHPQQHELLIKVLAVSVNPVDLKLRAMAAKDAPPFRLGFDAVGIVIETGGRAEGFAAGDRVFYAGSAKCDGANGSYHLVDSRLVGHAPKTLSDADVAAMPLTALTAWETLFERLGYQSQFAAAQPRTLLVINGAGGVGSVTLQLARLAGIHATATASRPESADWCRAMGAAAVVDHAALTTLPDMSFDNILCGHDADRYFDTMTRLIAPQGMICSVVGLRQPQNLMPLFQKSAGFVWEYMFTRATHGTQDMARQGQILTLVAELMEARALKSTRSVTLRGLSAASLQAAYDRVALGQMTGKLVITLEA